MGFFKRLLGIETKPGEPAPLTDAGLEGALGADDLPCFIYFFHLWCSSCQVMGGLLNEIGPEYADRARFYKLDISKNPSAASRFAVSAVPTIAVFRKGELIDQNKGLLHLNDLKEWIERNI